MIGQNIGLPHLMPLAIEQRKADILVEGHCYPGDLLNSVLTREEAYWVSHPQEWAHMCRLLEANAEQLRTFDTMRELRRKLAEGVTGFRGLRVE